MEEPSLPVVPEEETDLPSGARLGKYQIVRLLGAGGMGSVYEAVHTEIGKRVAVKTLAPAVAAIPGARQRFLREAQLTSRLRHPNIVDLTDMGTEGRIAYLVMELLAGEDLSHRLERTGPMAPRDLVDLMLPVCAALIAAHDAGIVHRDLKPHNIFLANGHRGVEPKVLDFGISKSSDSEVSVLTSTGSVIGTPHYLAPEQIKDARSASAASDQYSLGVIFYRCLADANPFEGDSIFSVLQSIVTEMPTPLRQRRGDLPEGLDRVVARAMNPVPRERFATVRGLGHALLPYASAKTRVVWEDTFTADAAPAVEPSTDPLRLSYTMPMPTPVPRGRGAALGSAMPRVDSGTLSPAVTTASSLGLEAPSGPRRGRAIAATLAAATLALGGFVLFSRGARAPETPPTVAVPAPAVAPPAAPVDEAKLRAAAEAQAREAQATRDAQLAKEAAAAKQAATEAAQAAEARAAEAKSAKVATRRHAPLHHDAVPQARPTGPAAHPAEPPPPNDSSNGASVLD